MIVLYINDITNTHLANIKPIVKLIGIQMQGHDKIANKIERMGCSSRLINLIVKTAIAIPEISIIKPTNNNSKIKSSIPSP